MNVLKIVEDLKIYRAQIDQAIASLEGLARRRSGAKRGRPPKWMSEAKSTPSPKRVFSEATKKKMAAAQKRRWAASRKKEAEA
ncbi:MAG: hypothetical protein ABL967_05750 [Bryobacteraceae bacterium]